jgi:hypothetical protein
MVATAKIVAEGGLFMPTSKSSIYFLERAGIVPTRRAQLTPNMDFTAMRFKTIPLSPPRPNPELIQDDNGTPPPDRGVTETWPWPSFDPENPFGG